MRPHAVEAEQYIPYETPTDEAYARLGRPYDEDETVTYDAPEIGEQPDDATVVYAPFDGYRELGKMPAEAPKDDKEVVPTINVLKALSDDWTDPNAKHATKEEREAAQRARELLAAEEAGFKEAWNTLSMSDEEIAAQQGKSAGWWDRRRANREARRAARREAAQANRWDPVEPAADQAVTFEDFEDAEAYEAPIDPVAAARAEVERVQFQIGANWGRDRTEETAVWIDEDAAAELADAHSVYYRAVVEAGRQLLAQREIDQAMEASGTDYVDEPAVAHPAFVTPPDGYVRMSRVLRRELHGFGDEEVLAAASQVRANILRNRAGLPVEDLTIHHPVHELQLPTFAEAYAAETAPDEPEEVSAQEPARAEDNADWRELFTDFDNKESRLAKLGRGLGSAALTAMRAPGAMLERVGNWPTRRKVAVAVVGGIAIAGAAWYLHGRGMPDVLSFGGSHPRTGGATADTLQHATTTAPNTTTAPSAEMRQLIQTVSELRAKHPTASPEQIGAMRDSILRLAGMKVQAMAHGMTSEQFDANAHQYFLTHPG